jgi:5'-deoxynucleotidase
MKSYYEPLFFKEEEDAYLWRLEKAADKLSALIKCIEEEKAGNTEFKTAYQSLYQSIKAMELKETDIFMEEFLPSYRKTLDELK